MKIHVGYHFDGGSFPGELKGAMAAEGVVTTGPLGLVSILETRLGIVGRQHGQPLRIARYLAGMDRLCQQTHPFYKKSFKADSWSSAKRLLALRDQLRLSGWDGSDPGSSARLADMALLEIEAKTLPGIPERIDNILGAMSSYGITGLTGVSLYGHPAKEWPSCWRRVFEGLEKAGVHISAAPSPFVEQASTDLEQLQKALSNGGEPSSFQADGSIVRLVAPTALEAADALAAWLASGKNAEDDIAIIAEFGSDVLDSAMGRHGLPRPGGGSRSQWRAALQLLPLALGVHWAPFDPQRYLEFLTAPICPLHPVMASRLIRALEQTPGIGGKDWHRAISHCEAWATKQSECDDLLDALRFWTEVKRASPHAGLDAETIRSICLRISQWAAKGSPSSEGNLMMSVSGMAVELADAVAETGREAIPKPQLDRMLDSVIGGGVMLSGKTEAARWAVLSHPGQLGGSVDSVIWWNFTMESTPSCRSPWTAAEAEALSQSGVHMDDLELGRNMELAAWTQAARNASRKLILVMPQQDGGETLPPHPFWENMVAALRLSENDDIPSMTVSSSHLFRGEGVLMGRTILLSAVDDNAAIEFQRDWEAPPKVIGRRGNESPSGMSQLIKCPLAWVLNYVIGVDAVGNPTLPVNNQLRGSFSHSIVEALIDESRNWEPEAAAKRAMEIFESRLKEQAASYLLPGMETDRENLRYRLGRAVSDLFERIESAKLSILESERRVERTDVGGQTYVGYIDISLEDKKGNPVVWDMKWSNRSKIRREEMEKGVALQLAAYCWMLNRDELPAFGAYYMLAQTELISSNAPWLPPEDVVDTDLKATWEKVHRRYDEIIAELVTGKVEAIATDESEEEKDLDIRSVCDFCDYGMVCGVGYE